MSPRRSRIIIWTVVSLGVAASGAYGVHTYRRAQALVAYMDGAHMAEHCGDLAAAAEQYRQALAVDPKYLPARAGLADVYFEQSEPEKAVREHRRGIAADTRNPEAHLGLARALIECHRYKEAAECLERGLQLVPSDIHMRMLLQHVYRWSGQRDKAARALAELNKLAPNLEAVKSADRAAWAAAIRARSEAEQPHDGKRVPSAAASTPRSPSTDQRSFSR